jgi:TonB family protein
VVLLSARIQADGRARDIEILQPFPFGLSWQTLGAIRKWRFKPATRNGDAVPAMAQIAVRFRLR